MFPNKILFKLTKIRYRNWQLIHFTIPYSNR